MYFGCDENQSSIFAYIDTEKKTSRAGSQETQKCSSHSEVVQELQARQRGEGTLPESPQCHRTHTESMEG